MKIILLFCIAFTFSSCRKDDYSTSDFGFTKTFNFGKNETIQKVIIIENELYIFGSIQINGLNSMHLIKLDTLGNVITNTIFESASNETGTDIIHSSDNSLILIGSTDNSGSTDIIIKKTDLVGNVIWSKIIGGIENETSNGIIETEQGHFCIAGTTRSYGVGNNDLYIVWVNQNGEVIREKTYGGIESDGSTAILNSNTDLIILGYTNSWGAGGQDYLVLKVNSVGDSIWAKTYGGPEYEESQGFVKTNSGGYIINGHSNSTDPLHDMFAVGTNSNGGLLWKENLGGALHDGGQAILKNSDGNYVLIGRSMSFGNGTRNLYLTTITESGILLSEKSILTDSFDWINSGIELNRYYYLVGYTSIINAGESDVLIMKIKK